MYNKQDNVLSFKKKKQENVTKKRGKFILFVVILFAIIYVPSFVYWVSPSNISLGILDLGEIEDSLYVQGWMIRDETIVYNDKEGIFFPEIGQSQRVQSEGEVALMLDVSKKNLIYDLEETNKKLLERVAELSMLEGSMLPHLSRIESQIESKIRKLRLEFQEGLFSEVGEYRRELNILMSEKFEVIYNYDASEDVEFNNLRKIGKSIRRQIKENSTSIYAPKTGLVSYVIDGSEELLKKEKIDGINKDILKQIQNKKPIVMPVNRIVGSGEPLFKVVNDSSYYIIASIPRENFGVFSKGDRINMRIHEADIEVSGKVEFVNVKKTGEILAGIKLDRALAQTVFLRDVNISIITNRNTGYKVRKDSLMEFDKAKSKAKIMVIRGGTTRIINVNVLGISDDFAIIEELKNQRGLSVYVQYVLNPENVREGYFIK